MDPRPGPFDRRAGRRNPRVEAENPRVGSPDPAVCTPDPRVETRHPRVPRLNPRVGTQNRRVASQDPRVASRNPGVGSQNPRVLSQNPRVRRLDRRVWRLAAADRQGDAWLSEIHRAMDRAAVAVLLISKDFLTSGFIKGTEVPHLLKRRADDGLRVIPLFVRHCPWQAVEWLAEIQGGPKMRSRSPITGGPGPRRSSLTWRWKSAGVSPTAARSRSGKPPTGAQA
ncbi:MAG: TIR domain-containing protein [Thermoanaerobaculia bacterium]